MILLGFKDMSGFLYQGFRVKVLRVLEFHGLGSGFTRCYDYDLGVWGLSLYPQTLQNSRL